MSFIKNNKTKSYLIVGVTIMGLGAIKGLYNGLRRTNKRDINDGGPCLNVQDGLISTIGSSGVIVSASTLLGAFEGGMVGLIWPLNLPWGLYQYAKNQLNTEELSDYIQPDQESEQEQEQEQENSIQHQDHIVIESLGDLSNDITHNQD
ncbi:uncharacterized protein METZ01_LOCUS146740 [marine metagenome]|uniref:Uncharacterized protein n=1 Tax=marine metagenome TaxID=408172 RepID=A0A381ZX89_9ZZZZ